MSLSTFKDAIKTRPANNLVMISLAIQLSPRTISILVFALILDYAAITINVKFVWQPEKSVITVVSQQISQENVENQRSNKDRQRNLPKQMGIKLVLLLKKGMMKNP